IIWQRSPRIVCAIRTCSLEMRWGTDLRLLPGKRHYRRGGENEWMLLSSIALLTFIGFAEPADAQVTAPVRRVATRTQPKPPPNWNGPQYGAFGGASTMPMNFVEPGAVLCPVAGLAEARPACLETPFGFSGTRSSFTFGGFVGYNVQFGTFVGGVEGDIAWKRGSISQTLGTTATGLLGPAITPGVFSTFTRTEYFSGTLTH